MIHGDGFTVSAAALGAGEFLISVGGAGCCCITRKIVVVVADLFSFCPAPVKGERENCCQHGAEEQGPGPVGGAGVILHGDTSHLLILGARSLPFNMARIWAIVNKRIC